MSAYLPGAGASVTATGAGSGAGFAGFATAVFFCAAGAFVATVAFGGAVVAIVAVSAGVGSGMTGIGVTTGLVTGFFVATVCVAGAALIERFVCHHCHPAYATPARTRRAIAMKIGARLVAFFGAESTGR